MAGLPNAPRAASESGELLAAATRAATAARDAGRRWLRVAGALTQLTAGVCLLLGTIGFVLVQQNKTGQLGAVLAWLALAMLGLVLGGLIYRGGVIRMIVAAAIDAGFGLVLVTFDAGSLHRLLTVLPGPDIDTIGSALVVAGAVMLGAGLACLVALPQGRRLASDTRTAMSTARGFPPPPVPVRGAAIAPAVVEEPSRRRLYP
ncbi:MAG TPA: hypothetical protein VFP84_01235, partial [Kofleriaceae bacterium]|nr:hypothetical protein [Kofleriaceae bacterium]